MDKKLSASPIEEFAQHRVHELLENVRMEWARCAEDAGADAVHDLRVALRRLNEALRLVRRLYAKPGLKQVRAELKQVLRMAGSTRDVDIAVEQFEAADIGLPMHTKLFLDNERAVIEAGLRAALASGMVSHFDVRWLNTLRLRGSAVALREEGVESDRYGSPNNGRLDRLLGSVPHLGIWAVNANAADNARLVLPALLSDYCASGDKLAGSTPKPGRWHGLRLAGKHVRYAFELFRPIYGKKMDSLIESLKDNQSDLGKISDTTATVVWLKQHGLIDAPEGRQLKIYLEQSAAKRAQKFVDYWREHWGLSWFRDQWLYYLGRYAGQSASIQGKPLSVESEEAAETETPQG